MKKKEIFLTNTIYPSSNLFPVSQTVKYMLFKFKLFKQIFDDPQLPPTYEDTGMYYIQYKQIDKYGNTGLKVKYERSESNV